MKYRTLILAIFLGASALSSSAQTNPPKTNQNAPFPTEDIVIALSKGGRPEQEKAIALISKQSGEASPPLLYMGAKRLFEQGKSKQAVFWLLSAQLRGRYDLMRCTDETAERIIIVLNNGVAKTLNDWLLENPDALLEELPKVMKWDASTPFNYDPRWIYFHANQPEPDAIKLRPTAEWPHILAQARASFEAGIQDYVKILKDPAKKEALLDLKKINEKRAYALTRGQTYTLSPKEIEIEARARGFIANESDDSAVTTSTSKASPPAASGSPSPGSAPASKKQR